MLVSLYGCTFSIRPRFLRFVPLTKITLIPNGCASQGKWGQVWIVDMWYHKNLWLDHYELNMKERSIMSLLEGTFRKLFFWTTLIVDDF